MPKKLDHDIIRNRIAKCAVKVFIRQGFYNTKMTDIAKECAIGRTALYQYFDNRDQIFVHTLNQLLDELVGNFNQILERSDLTPLQKIQEIISNLFSVYYHKEELMVILFEFYIRVKLEKVENFHDLNARTEALQGVFKKLLDQGIMQGEIRKVDTQSMSHLLFSIVRSFLIQASLYEEITLVDLTESTMILVDGLKV